MHVVTGASVAAVAVSVAEVVVSADVVAVSVESICFYRIIDYIGVQIWLKIELY